MQYNAVINKSPISSHTALWVQEYRVYTLVIKGRKTVVFNECLNKTNGMKVDNILRMVLILQKTTIFYIIAKDLYLLFIVKFKFIEGDNKLR